MNGECVDNCKEIVKHTCNTGIPPLLTQDVWVIASESNLEYDIEAGVTTYTEITEILFKEIKKLKKEIRELKKLG